MSGFLFTFLIGGIKLKLPDLGAEMSKKNCNSSTVVEQTSFNEYSHGVQETLWIRCLLVLSKLKIQLKENEIEDQILISKDLP